jgi:hypothetical protein
MALCPGERISSLEYEVKKEGKEDMKEEGVNSALLIYNLHFHY